MRTLTAPGVEWKETDRSGYSPAMVGTACLVPGFSRKGEVYKPMEFTSRAAWSNYYGDPTTEAERYFYAAACEVLNQNGRLYTIRLPYDNASFEKMVGVKYTVDWQGVKLSDDSCSAFIEVNDPDYGGDSEINEAALISTTAIPTLYDLAKIDEYKTGESKVKADTFLIVDTTGATYQKIQEDSRKGENRELLGIMPVVTTAANALYTQSMLNVSPINVKNYEVLGNDNGIRALYTEDENETSIERYLKQADLAGLINTKDYFNVQTNTFESKIIRTRSTKQFGDKDLSTVYQELNNFCTEYQIGYDFGNFQYLSSVDEFISIMSALLSSAEGNEVIYNDNSIEVSTLSALISNASNLVNFVRTTEFYFNDNFEQVEKNLTDGISSNDNEISGFTVGTLSGELGKAIKVYEKNMKDLGNTLFAASDFMDEGTVKKVENDDGTYYYCAVLNVATKLDKPLIKSVNGDTDIPDTLALNANQFFPTIQPASDGEGYDPENLKDIGVVVYKLYLDPSEGNKVSYEAVEAFCGSLCKDDVDPNTGMTKFIDTIINSQSQYINFFSNCFATPASKNFYKEKCDILLADSCQGSVLGFYSSMTEDNISVGKSILEGLNKAFDKVKDINERDIDIVCDAGLANIASYLKAIFGSNGIGRYDLNIVDDFGNSMLGMWKCQKANDPCVKIWKTVEQKFDTFCKKERRDCMFIADGLRPLVLQGQKKIVRDSKPTNTIDANIIPYIPAICGLNTSYGAGYADWFEMADDYSGDLFWCPPSIKAMGIYINTDVNYKYWDAPAGLNRGMVAATDISFSPNPKQAGCFYEKNWNFAINYPNDGIVLEGQKTFQVKPSAFDRINVRRLFLRLERMSYKVARYFVYEGNTAYTRQRLVDTLDPYFKEAKIGGGIYDYRIICDESNNSPETIDRNELHVSIGIKPTKTIEFIILNFIAGSTGSSWEEIMK